MTGPARPYQYVVLRCVPRVDREEFVNVGVALYCQADAFLDVAHRIDAERLRAFSDAIDPGEVEAALEALERHCQGDGPSGGMSLGERFGLVTAPRSTVLQPGPVHGGVCDDPRAELDHLMHRLVLSD